MSILPLVRKGFSQGSYPSFDPSAVPPTGVWRGRNIRISESGVLKIRPGYVRVGGTAGKGSAGDAISAFGDILVIHGDTLYRVSGNFITAIKSGIETTGTPKLVRWSHGDEDDPVGEEIVYIFTGQGIWQTDGTEAGTKLVEPTVPEDGEAKNLLLLEDEENGNGNGDPQQDLDSGPARSQQILLRVSDGQRLVVAGDPTRPNSAWMCEPREIGYWAADQEINLPMDGGRLVAISSWYGAIIFFRDRDYWAYFKDNEGDTAGKGPVVQDRSIGCAAPGSVVPVPGVGIFFLGGPAGRPDNVYAITHVQAIESQVRVVAVGDPVRRQLLQAIDQYGTDGISATYYQGEYRLSIPTNLGKDRVFVYSTLETSRGWTTDTGPRTNKFFMHSGALHGALYGEGQVIKFEDDALSDDGEPIPVNIAFRREDLQPGPSRIKSIQIYAAMRGRTMRQRLYWFGGQFNEAGFNEGMETDATVVAGTRQHLDVDLVTEGDTVTVRTVPVRIDYTVGGLEYDAVYIFEAKFRPSLKAHFTQVQIRSTQPNEDIAILGYGINYVPRGETKGHAREVTS